VRESKWWHRIRDAITGRFTTKDGALRRPESTVDERVERRPYEKPTVTDLGKLDDQTQ